MFNTLSLLLCEAGNSANAGTNGHVLLNSITLHRGHRGGPPACPLVEWPDGMRNII